MGEAPKRSPEESVGFLTRVLDRVAGRAGVIVGVSAPGLDNLARLAHTAMDRGAAGVMVAPMAGLNTEAKVLGYFVQRSEEHTSELQSLMRISYAVFCLKKKKLL